VLKGFNKNYFKLSAIQASSVNITLNAKKSNILSYHFIQKKIENENEAPPPIGDECLILDFLLPIKPLYCECIFKQKTIYALNIITFKKPSTHFSNSHSGISPPNINLI